MRGRLTRIRAGAFVDPATWAATSDRQRHLAQIRAVVASRRSRPILCGPSAAAIWGVPLLGRWDGQVHLLAPKRTDPASKNGVRWHRTAFDDDEVVDLGGLLVTGLGRTVLDLARAVPFVGAVAALDYGVSAQVEDVFGNRHPGAWRDGLLTRVDRMPGFRGVRNARAALTFCDGRSASAGESVSRANIHLLGFPAPDLQVSMPRADGGEDIVDYDWPEFGLFGEFDGHGKYLRDRYVGNRSIVDVIMAEKRREDRIRRRHRPFAARWQWREAMRPRELEAVLLEAGLRRSRRARR